MKVIKIGAVWCSACLVMKPRWEELEKEYPWLETEYLDYDQDQEQVEKYGVESKRLPVFIFLDRQGEELERLAGEYSRTELAQIIEKHRGK